MTALTCSLSHGGIAPISGPIVHWRLALFSAIRVNEPARLLLDLARLAAQFIALPASAVAQDLHQVSSVRSVRQEALLGEPLVGHRLAGCFDDDAAVSGERQ